MPFGIEFNIGLGFFDRRQGEVRRRLLKLFVDTVDLFAQLLQAFSRFGADCSKTIVIDLSLIARCAAFSQPLKAAAHTRKAAYRGCLPGKLRSAYPVLTGPNDSFGPFS